MSKVDLTKLVAQTLRNVVTIVGRPTTRFDLGGNELAPITQEFATLEGILRRIENGELVVVEPETEAEESDDGADDADAG